MRISDLPRNSLLAITVWDLNTRDHDVPVAGSTISLFDRYGEFRQGQYEIRMWPNKMANCNLNTSTPGIVSDLNASNEDEPSLTTTHNNDSFPILDELDRLAKVIFNSLK